MRIFTKNKEEYYKLDANNRFYFFIIPWFFIMYLTLLKIDQYMPLNLNFINLGIAIFTIFFIVFVFFGIERRISIFLKKSIFSIAFLVFLFIAYFFYAYLVYNITVEKTKDTKLHNMVKEDFENVSFISSIENALLLKKIVIVEINDKINKNDIEDIIIKKYQNRDDIAFEFILENEYGKEQTCIIYSAEFSKNTILNCIILYLLIFIYLWLLNWTFKEYKTSDTKWKKTKELIGILFVSTFILAIPLPVLSHSYWYNNANNTFTEKEISQYIDYMKLTKDKKHVVILKNSNHER